MIAKRVNIRWAVQRDLPDIKEIEEASFKDSIWNEKDFRKCLAKHNVICKVVDVDSSVVGFMVYQLEKDRYILLNLAVHPKFRRKRAAAILIDELVRKTSKHRRKYIIAEVRENNLSAQLFFRWAGFKAEKVLRNYYNDTEEDGYKFVFTLKKKEPVLVGDEKDEEV